MSKLDDAYQAALAAASKPAKGNSLVSRDVRAAALIPPHEVSDFFSNKELYGLRLAYRGYDPVNPIVVIARKDRKYVGLVGSHRINAMQRVFRGRVIPAKYLLIIPEKTARAVFKSSERLTSLFDRYLREQLTDEFPIGAYNEFIAGIAALSPVLATALADQVHE